ncbi:MAG: ROK family protein [Phycisphaerae bacterium]
MRKNLQFLGVDIGGTTVKFGLCNESNDLLLTGCLPTFPEQGAVRLAARIRSEIDRVVQSHGALELQIAGVGVGAPGPLDHHTGVIFEAPNLPGWKNVYLAQLMQEQFDVPVTIENDANAAAFGESVAGAGKDARSVVMLTLGTGVGGGIILNDVLLRGDHSSGAELGHMIIEPQGRLCGCGQHGCMEQYVSATALVRDYHERLANSGAVGGPPIEHRTAEAIASSDNPLAVEAWDAFCRYLAIGCINLTRIVDPTCIILGGGVANAGDALLLPTRKHFQTLNWHLTKHQPRIIRATLGEHAGVVGSAALARIALAQS